MHIGFVKYLGDLKMFVIKVVDLKYVYSVCNVQILWIVSEETDEARIELL